jgi:hypothetical protein
MHVVIVGTRDGQFKSHTLKFLTVVPIGTGHWAQRRKQDASCQGYAESTDTSARCRSNRNL